MVGQQGVDDGGIGLSATHQKHHVGVGAMGGGTNLFYGGKRVGVGAIAGGLHKVRLRQAAQNLRVSTLGVVANEGYHGGDGF